MEQIGRQDEINELFRMFCLAKSIEILTQSGNTANFVNLAQEVCESITCFQNERWIMSRISAIMASMKSFLWLNEEFANILFYPEAADL